MTMEFQSPALEVLLVEDNPGDVLLTEEAFQEIPASVHLHVVGDGAQALQFLRREEGYSNAPTPDLILLDLNLPTMTGSEVLEYIKADPELRRIPVVILTTSNSEDDIVKSYDLHANCFVTKPIDFDEFASALRLVNEFWTRVARLPPAQGAPRIV
jgi:CheY-like chemotaxis protein